MKPPIPAEHWDETSKRTLAQAMVGEAGWNRPDHVAIAWVLARRWKRYHRHRQPITFDSFIRRYSSPLKQQTERAIWVQSLPWGELEGRYGRRWRKVRHLVEDWGEGRVTDPCRKASHWGGTMDRPGSGWTPVHCGATRNIFYSSARRRGGRS